MAAPFVSSTYNSFLRSTEREMNREEPILPLGTRTVHRSLECLPRDGSAGKAWPMHAGDLTVHDVLAGTILLEVPEASVDPTACNRNKYPPTHGSLATVPLADVEKLRFTGIALVGLPVTDDGQSRVINPAIAGYQTLPCADFEVHPTDTLIWVIPGGPNNLGGKACVMPERLLRDANAMALVWRADPIHGLSGAYAAGTLTAEQARAIEVRRVGKALYASKDGYVDADVFRG